MVVVVAALVATGLVTVPPTVAEAAAVERILGPLGRVEVIAPGVTLRTFTTTAAAGGVSGDVVSVDLRAPGVRTDLLSPGAVAGRASVLAMANGAKAVVGINGDFFDIGRTSASAGPAVMGGRALKSAVPQGRRGAPAVPGAEMDYVFAVGVDGLARVDRLDLVATVTGPARRVLPVVALNQFAVPVGGIGIFTADWGAADRARTLCGSDVDRTAPCAADRTEVDVRGGVVTAVGRPGAGVLPRGVVALVGRDRGAVALRTLKVGNAVTVRQTLAPRSGVAPHFAVGGSPILIGGHATERLDDRVRAARSAAAASADRHRMVLVTVNGTERGAGITLSEFSALLAQLGMYEGVNLDGGGSSSLVVRRRGAPTVTVVNKPKEGTLRLVGNGIGIFTR